MLMLLGFIKKAWKGTKKAAKATAKVSKTVTKVAIKAAIRPDKLITKTTKGVISGSVAVTKGTWKTALNSVKLSGELGKFVVGQGSKKKLGRAFAGVGKAATMTAIDAAISGLGVGGIIPDIIMDVVEEKVKHGRKRYRLPAKTQALFNQFIRTHRNRWITSTVPNVYVNKVLRKKFTYSTTYRTINWWYNARPPKDGMTFENRIYVKRRPNIQSDRDLGLLFHEYIHTFQYKKHGLSTFSQIYSRNYLKNFLRGHKGSQAYTNIRFEVEAYFWEKVFLDWLVARRQTSPPLISARPTIRRAAPKRKAAKRRAAPKRKAVKRRAAPKRKAVKRRAATRPTIRRAATSRLSTRTLKLRALRKSKRRII